MLETARLRLRMFEESDLYAYARMCADPEVMHHLGGHPLTRAETWRQIATYLGHWQLRGYGLWANELKQSRTFIGRVGLWSPEGWPGLEVGWAIDRPFWGNGYATEAGATAFRHAFEALDVSSFISVIHPDNPASMRVAEKLGATRLQRAVVNGWDAWVVGHFEAQALRQAQGERNVCMRAAGLHTVRAELVEGLFQSDPLSTPGSTRSTDRRPRSRLRFGSR